MPREGPGLVDDAVVATWLAGALFAGAMVVGCDDTVSHQSETKVKDNGTVVKKDDKVTRNADGTTTHTETKSVDKTATDHDGAAIKVDVDKK